MGGEGSKVVMHYDMDLANNFHFNFAGKKKVILYGPDQTKYLYKVPYSIVSMEIIDMDDPDFSNIPLWQKLRVTKLFWGMEMRFLSRVNGGIL